MNKIAFKKLKRKRKLRNRVRCHGNKMSCVKTHQRQRELPKEKPKEIKKSLWQKIKDWIGI